MQFRMVIAGVMLAVVEAATPIPHGKYCGPAMGYNMNVSFIDDKLLNFSFHYWGTGSHASCAKEPWTLQPWGSDQKLMLTNIGDDEDCLGLNLRKHAGFDGFFVYHSDTDTIEVTQDSVNSYIKADMCAPNVSVTIV